MTSRSVSFNNIPPSDHEATSTAIRPGTLYGTGPLLQRSAVPNPRIRVRVIGLRNYSADSRNIGPKSFAFVGSAFDPLHTHRGSSIGSLPVAKHVPV